MDAETGPLLPAALPAWDYSTDLTLARIVHLDLAGIREDCGLPDDAPLRLCVRYWPSSSRLRHSAFQAALPTHASQNVTVVELTAPGRDLGGLLTVETLLELAADLRTDHPFVPHRAGSILWHEQTRVALEGAAGLLPTAPVSFSEAGLPAGAAWYVSMDGGDWRQAAMGSLLVLLNTDNPAVRKALEAGHDEATALLWDTLGIDIVTDLVGRALDDEAFDEDQEATGSEGDLTMAGLIRSLVRIYLANPTETPAVAIKRLRDERKADPSRFRAYVQKGVGFPREASR
ncbi:hypothetical protein ACFW1A_02870 [Kitasatospora sp. NPDC058965]|uniref:hypothetical protein n=1 Tax=Kitasatospora sp. NPDC058965 TaxID=3346682 RepID=UPI003679F673